MCLWGQLGSMHDTSVLYNAMRVDEKLFPHPQKVMLLILELTIFHV
jgi:hypothetical protein